LLDCGWDIYFDITKINALLHTQLSRIDLVLITHPDIEHLGALPYAVGKLGLKAPIYTTFPVFKMGQMNLYDSYLSRSYEVSGNEGSVALPDWFSEVPPRQRAELYRTVMSHILDQAQNPTQGSSSVMSGEASDQGGQALGTFAAELQKLMVAAGVTEEQVLELERVLRSQKASGMVLFDLDDVDAAFGKFEQLKYSQHLRLGGKGKGMMITPYPAGRLLGGAYWEITRGTDQIVYAVDYNHRRERHLNPTTLKTLSRPSLLITDSYNAQQPTWKPYLIQKFIDSILDTVRKGGNVLIPVDAAGRNLEALLILDEHWRANRLGNYQLCFLSPVALNTLEFCQSQLEWMTLQIAQQFDIRRQSPFEFRHTHILHSMGELNELGNSPKVVLTTDKTLQYGFGKSLLVKWAGDPKNMILFIERCAPGTLASELLGFRESQQNASGGGKTTGAHRQNKRQRVGGEEQPMKNLLRVQVPVKVALRGAELTTYREEEARKRREEMEEEDQRREAEEMEKLKLELNQGRKEGTTENSDDDTEESRAKRRRVEQSLFRRYSVPRHLMFGCTEGQAEVDEYGARLTSEERAVIGAGLWTGFETNRSSLSALPETKQKEELRTSEIPQDIPEEFLGEPLEEIPTKIVIQEKLLEVECEIRYVNMEGRSDGRSVQNLLAKVAPRRLVLVHGGASDTRHLEQFARKSKCHQVYTPCPGEAVHISLDNTTIEAKLQEGLFRMADFQSVGSYEVAAIEAKMERQNDYNNIPVLHPLSDDEDTPQRTPVFLRVGDIVLPALKAQLIEAGISAQFKGDMRGGKLICNGSVVVKKTENNRVLIEGPLCDDYFTVRSVIYSQFTVI